MKIVFEHLTKVFPGKGKKASPVTAVNEVRIIGSGKNMQKRSACCVLNLRAP